MEPDNEELKPSLTTNISPFYGHLFLSSKYILAGLLFKIQIKNKIIAPYIAALTVQPFIDPAVWAKTLIKPI
jgi:hypothetical protein